MPANDYYDSTNVPATGAAVTSATLRAEYNLIEEGFNKCPPLTGNGGKVVIVNAGGTALTADSFASLASAALALKANVADAVFTGLTTVPQLKLDTTTLTVSGAELNFVDGVTSNIQTQLTVASAAIALKANTASPTFTGTVTAPVLAVTSTSSFTGTSTFTGDITKSKSAAGIDSFILLENTSIAASSGANLLIKTAGTAAGDPSVSFTVTGGESWTVGIDNSDGDKYKISNSLALGFQDYFIIDPATGLAEFPMGLKITGATASPVDGNIVKSTGSGLVLRGVAGSTSDFAVINAGGGTAIISNLTGTLHINIGGSFGRGTPVTKTADFTVGASENWLINNKAGSTCTVTLPSAAAYTGREIDINNYQAFTVVSASSNVISQTGTGPSTAILAATAGKWATLVSDGTNWRIMRSN